MLRVINETYNNKIQSKNYIVCRGRYRLENAETLIASFPSKVPCDSYSVIHTEKTRACRVQVGIFDEKYFSRSILYVVCLIKTY